MANVKVAVRVRPLSKRESAEGGRIAVQVDEKVLRITNIKLDGKLDGPGDSREKLMGFGFDYCYWSVDPNDPNYSSQEEVFQDLGTLVLSGAVKGYNVCLFAYGQTGSGKTYTMMGTPVSLGLTPRICEALFSRADDNPEGHNSCRVEVSFLEIYNERVRDLLQRPDKKKPFTLRVREHPEKGPYVQGLSQHVVSDYKQVVDLLDEGIANRITAATHVHDASSRSHAIFTIQYTQAILENNLPSEIVSKINLVDLAGSERADPNYCRDRITEGSNINKSLVTLGIVISTLAQNCQMFSSCQSISSMGSEGEGSSAGSQSSSQSGSGRRHCYIPYRDSTLTWLLKESLGGNSHTVMVATISPSSSSYSDTLSTLRYASHARSIVNKPQVNEDASVKLIRELREEIDRLKTMLMSFELRNSSHSLSEDRNGNLADIVLQNELKVEQLTKDWSDKWKDKQELMEEYRVDINREKAGVLIDSHLPHLISVDGDVLSTGIVFYHLREGTTRIGRSDGQDESDIVLQGPGVESVCCEIVNERGVVTLRPGQGGLSAVNGREITEPCRLAQGAVIVLGRTHTFRFNHPAEAAVLRQRRRVTPLLPPACPVPGRETSESLLLSSGSCDWLDLEEESNPSPRYSLSPSLLARQEPRGMPDEEKQLGEMGSLSEGSWERAEAQPGAQPPETPPSWRLVEQQRYVEGLREQILAAQLRAEQELEREQARINQQLRDNQQWLLQEKQRLASLTPKERRDLAVQTDPASSSESGVQLFMEAAGCGPSLQDRKRLVQQELLRSHALRRAERRIRRKRVRFQLERISRKQHLLEAKRELQQLEERDRDRDSLGEQQLPALAKGRRRGSFPTPSRRHSFSADLLSRLYPQHIPIYSHFLKQKKSPEASAWSRNWCTRIPRKCLSEECLPAARVRKGTRVYTGHRHSRHKSGSVENLKMPDIKLSLSAPDFHTWTNKDQPRICTTTAAITHRIHESQQPSSSASGQSKNKDSTASNSRRSKPLGKSSLEPKGSAKINRGLKRIKMLISQSVSPGIKTVLAGMFRKPPSGWAGRATKSSKKAATRLSCSLERSAMKERPIKMASSFEGLDQLGKSISGCSQERKWHSAEVLSDGIKQTADRLLYGWEEDCESSDSDNLSSLDSLSSAYTKALTEQLMQEETAEPELSDGASDDSQMSQDSLAGTGSGKKLIDSPKVAVQSLQRLRLFNNPSSPGNWLDKWGRSVSLDSLADGEAEETEDRSPRGSGTSDEIPAEIYWKLQSPRTQDVHNTVLHKPHGGSEEKGMEMETLLKGGNLESPPVMDDSPHLGDPLSSDQTHSRERAVSLSLTDAWSSCESSESPRMLKDSLNKSQWLHTKQALFKTPSKVDGSKQKADNRYSKCSPDLSATGKGLESETSSCISTLNQQSSQGERNYWILNGTCVENKVHPGQPITVISAAKSNTLGSDARRNESCLAVTSACSLRSEAEVESQDAISHWIGSPGSTVFNRLDGRKQDINIPSPTSRNKSPVTFEPDLVEHLQTTPDKDPVVSGSNVTDLESTNHFSPGYPEERLSLVEGNHVHAEPNKSVSSEEVCVNEQEGIIRDSNLSSTSATAAQVQELTQLILVPVNTQHSLDEGMRKDGVDTSPSFSEQETQSSPAIGDLKHSVKAKSSCISGSTCPSAGPNLQVRSVQFRKDSGYTSSEAPLEVHAAMGDKLIPNKESLSSAGTLLNNAGNHSLQAAVFETFPADPALVPDLGITNEEKTFSLAGEDTEELISNPSAENENNGFPDLKPNHGTTVQTDFLQEQQIARPNTGQPTEEFSSTSIRAEVSDMTNTPERATWEEQGSRGVGVGQRKDSIATELQNDIKLQMNRTQLECSSVQVSDQRTAVHSTNPSLDADPEPLQKEKERGMEIEEGSLETGMTDEGFNEGSRDNVSDRDNQVDLNVPKDTIKKQIEPSEFRKDICAVKMKDVHLTAPTCKSHISDLDIKESREDERSDNETELRQKRERINSPEGVRLEDTENVRPRRGVERNQQAVRREGKRVLKEGKKADGWSMVHGMSTGETAQCSSALRENDVPDCEEDRESEVQKVTNEASKHRDSGVFDVEERHSTIREGEKGADIPNQTENEAADALGNSKVRKHHHSARYSLIPTGEYKLDHIGLLHANHEGRKAAEVREMNERDPKQHADVEPGTLNSTDTNQAVLQFIHKGNMSPQRDSRPTMAARTNKTHHVTRSDIPKGLQGRPIEVCTQGTNGLLKIKVEGTQSSNRDRHCGKRVSESMMKSRTPGGNVTRQACSDSAEASHLDLDVSSKTGAKKRYTFSVLKETNSATPIDKNAESRTSTLRDGAEEDSSASLIAAEDVPLTPGHMENHDVGLMSSTNWLENTGGDTLEFPETHSEGNETEELLIRKHLTEKPARPGSNNLVSSPLPFPSFSASSEGMGLLLNPDQLNTCKPAVLKDNYVRIDMAKFCLDSNKQSRFPPCSQNPERVRETEENKEGYVAQTKAQKIYPGPSQCNTRETSMERLKYAQIGDTDSFHCGVYKEESEEIEAVAQGEMEGSTIQILGNMTSEKIGTKQCHYSTQIPRIAEDDADFVEWTNDSHERAGASNKTSLKMERTKIFNHRDRRHQKDVTEPSLEPEENYLENISRPSKEKYSPPERGVKDSVKKDSQTTTPGVYKIQMDPGAQDYFDIRMSNWTVQHGQPVQYVQSSDFSRHEVRSNTEMGRGTESSDQSVAFGTPAEKDPPVSLNRKGAVAIQTVSDVELTHRPLEAGSDKVYRHEQLEELHETTGLLKDSADVSLCGSETDQNKAPESLISLAGILKKRSRSSLVVGAAIVEEGHNENTASSHSGSQSIAPKGGVCKGEGKEGEELASGDIVLIVNPKECQEYTTVYSAHKTCSEEQHSPTLTDKSAGSKHVEGPVNISAALTSSEGIGKQQISCGTPGAESREQGVQNLSSSKEQRQTDLPTAVLTEIAVTQDYRRGNVSVGCTSAVGFIELPLAEGNSGKDVEADSVDIRVIQRSAGIKFSSNQDPVFSTMLSPQALGEMHEQQKITAKQATQKHRELEADGKIRVPYTHIQYPTVCGATVGSPRVATTSAPSFVYRSSSLEDLESLSVPEFTVSDPTNEDSSSTDDRGSFWDNGDKATVDKNQKKKQKLRRGKPQPPPPESYNSSSSTSQDTTYSSSLEQSGEHLRRSPDRPSASSPRQRGNKHSGHSRLENSNEEHRAHSQKYRLSAQLMAGLPSDAEHGVETTANFHQGFRGMHAQSNGEFHLSNSPMPPDDDTSYPPLGVLKEAKTSLKSPRHQGKLFKKNTKTSCNEDPECTSSRPLTRCPSGAKVITHYSTGEGAQVPFLSHHRRHSRPSTRKERCHPQGGTSGLHDEKEMMHFGSSDINPYVHPWQQEETTRVGWKHHVFGSAGDISCQPPVQDGSNQRVMRCSSVDNGLNIQNSPLCSHLSSYANARAVSSTLSSVEDFRGQDSFETEYNSHQHSHPRPRDALNLESRLSSYRIPQAALGNSSVQVDEIMLLYPSEPKSTVKSLSEVTLTVTCDQGTQTSAGVRHRKVNRHRRSSTQVPVSRKEVEENVAQRPTSWASLQNMSIHLSQLLHNTSDLLGNLHSLGAGEPQLHSIRLLRSNTPDSSHSYILSNGRRKMDSCTQTSVDVGIQTDYLYQAMIKQHLPVEDTKRPQEVNVIVKVVGSDILNISQVNKDITLTLLERERKAAVKMQSMPDLRIGNASVLQTSVEPHHSADASPVCVRASTPSLESDQNSAPIIFGLSPFGSPSSLPGQSSSTSNLVRGCSISSPQLSRLENQAFQEGDTNGDCSPSSKAKAQSKQVQVVDRATSPILTLEAGISSPVARSKSTQCLTDGENTELQEDFLDGQRKYQSSFRYGVQEPRDSHCEQTESEDGLERDNCFITTSRRANRVVANVGKVSVVSEPRMRGRKSYPLKPAPSSMEDVRNSAGSKYFVDRSGRQIPVKMEWQSSSEEINLRKSSSVQHLPGSCSSTFNRLQGCAISTQENTSTQTHEGSLRIRTPCKTIAAHYLTASDGCEGWNGSASCHNQSPDPYPFEPSELSEMTVQLQEDNDDATSVAPSECNTEVLLNINPLVDDPQKTSHNQGKCRVPEDLPMHNKFSNWSGVHFCQPSRLSSAAVGTASGSQTQKMKRLSQGEPMENDSEFRAYEGERMREIEKLRRERAEIMSGVRLEMNPHQLTVELTEAKLNYGLGETDTLLKLHSGAGQETGGVTIKQQLYDRHMKSIEGLRRMREARLQSCRRARSLSPNKHPALCAGTRGEPASRDPDLPSKRREYLQQLRQGVVESTRVQEPKKWLAQTPSEIELLLRDYGKAREEARTEIARARDRLRERTEQEKRRLQQQALSQLVKDELRLRTRVSTSTLCTSSSLSLSSGPSSGYNSSNTTAPPGGSKATPQQGSEVTEESRARARGRPALQRQCLSEHDVCFEASANHCDVPAESQQPTHSLGTRGRGPSISSSSSASASYQEIATHTVASATSEIQAASEGDLGNLLKGKAAASWRYQSTERGVLAYYKAFPSPTKHGFLCAGVIEQPLHSVWCLIRDHSKIHLYDRAIKTAWVTSVESGIQLVYLVMDSSLCCLKQPRDFCCISAESKQEEQFVLALRSVYDEALPRPGRELVRGEVLPSAWVLQPDTLNRKEITKVVYMTQVDLGTPALPQRLLGFVAKRQAMVIANLASFFPTVRGTSAWS
ncbi:stAR-related lipid transfer protein 9 isoform X2 [Polyodon spathula]|uniref:stAR-related lipid transfer protein 9 isoform X2 n=1 Tax=Polyodon spathula TaxID=7913 RepID=UPI001B7DE77B|nr:stAR-related lipid transfer protein 9 isoform X2 [Polyodon spathula]